MRTLAAVFLLALLASGVALAQRHGAYGNSSGFGNVVFPGTGRPPASPGVSGFGNVVFPGTGGPPRQNVFSITDPSFARGLAGIVSGQHPYGSMSRGGGRNRNYVYVPYVYPVYTGGYDPYFQPEPQPEIMAYPQQQGPQQPVIINQNFSSPQPPEAVRVYDAPARTTAEMAAAEPTSEYYLIAFRDHSIYSAVAYYVEGETLHYFTQGNVHNQVSLALVDRPLTEQLNRERRVDVKLNR